MKKLYSLSMLFRVTYRYLLKTINNSYNILLVLNTKFVQNVLDKIGVILQNEDLQVTNTV